MKKGMKSLVATSVLAALLGSGVAMADSMTGNIGATSNYVWRGITQSGDGAAVSGGLDYSSDVGVYVGTWVSSTAWTNPDTGDTAQETDLYGGYTKDFGPVSVDVGVTRFSYPTYNALNWTEYTAKVGFGPAKLTYGHGNSVFGYIGVNSNYVALDLSHELKKDLSVGLHVGHWKFSDPINVSISCTGTCADDTMTEYGLSLTKGDFTFTVSDSNLDKNQYTQDGRGRVYASYTKSFDL